jgi:hypothetical protein
VRAHRDRLAGKHVKMRETKPNAGGDGETAPVEKVEDPILGNKFGLDDLIVVKALEVSLFSMLSQITPHHSTLVVLSSSAIHRTWPFHSPRLTA